ncbi:MAG: hypothetical protein ACR2PG_14925, partial [Hyphomicrobiaceae bacterium]
PPILVTGVALFEDPVAAPYALLATIIIVETFKAIAMKQVLGISYSSLLKGVGPAALSSLTMIPAVLITNRWLTDLELPVYGILAVETVVGALTYVSMLLLIDGRRILRDISRLMPEGRVSQRSATIIPNVKPENL